jgi:hypothetical protein
MALGDPLRQELAQLLRGEQAHQCAERILEGIRPELRHAKPDGMLPTIWQLLEHLRICQEDILQYMLDPSWVSPKWPDGYWPEDRDAPTSQMWDQSLASFHSDLDRAVGLTRDQAVDLLSVIPHTEGHTYLREILLLADHNAYHLGQIVQLRKLLRDWDS